jgi:endonuclease/exonuclease/phosphatase family metal-dependent hydrolase
MNSDTSTTFRIATWNLERPKLNGWKWNPLIQEKIREIDADIWILTETNASIVPSSTRNPATGYVPLASLPAISHSLGESCSTIWSRYGIKQAIRTFEVDTAVCAEIETPLGLMVVYGTIITYANDTGEKGISKKWMEHRKAIDEHSKNWVDIAKEFPNHLLCVAGDFNQNRDGIPWFQDDNENKKSVKLLTDELDKIPLRCVTEQDMRRDKGLPRANIDHICLSTPLAKRVSSYGCWYDKNLSDHNGVYVDIALL